MNTSLRPSSATTAAKIIQLRTLLEPFQAPLVARPQRHLPSGVPVLDTALQGGLWKGGLIELVASAPTCGSASLLCAMVRQAAQRQQWVGFIDGADSFDPQTLAGTSATRLLWIRCHTVSQALQSADLLLRDGNLPLVFLDLHRCAEHDLRRTPSHTWYRLQRMLEPTATAFVACTPCALIPCADARLLLQARFTLASLSQETPALLRKLSLHLVRQRSGWGAADEPFTPALAQAAG